MANSYTQFSESIGDITPQEEEWIKSVLALEGGSEEDEKKLMELLSLEGDPAAFDLGCWPYFEWKLAQELPKDLPGTYSDLWLYCEEGFVERHLEIFVREFICRFRPDYIFSITGADTCSKPRRGEFGGWWLVIHKDGSEGGNTWDAAQEAVKRIQQSRVIE